MKHLRMILVLSVLALLSFSLYAQPENSYQSGGNWYCDNGYIKSGNQCEKINIPANAWAQGSRWYCNNGYKRSGSECIEIKPPTNVDNCLIDMYGESYGEPGC